MLFGFTGRSHCQSMTVSNVAWFHREKSLSIHDCFKSCLVLQGEVTVNPVDKNSRTPLHYAVQSCENTIIDLLLGRGGYQAHYTPWHCHSGSLLGRISFCTCYHFCLRKPIFLKMCECCYMFMWANISDQNSHVGRHVLFSHNHSCSPVTLVLQGLLRLHPFICVLLHSIMTSVTNQNPWSVAVCSRTLSVPFLIHE